MLSIQYPKCSACRKAKKCLDAQFKLLATDGMLVKRPIVVDDNRILTGFKEAEWEETLERSGRT